MTTDIKLLKDTELHKVGEIISCSNKDAQSYVSNGYAEYVVEKKKETMSKKQQKELFIELSAEEKQIIQLLQERETLHIDEINLRSGLSSSAAAAAILNLELQNVIVSLPGKMYKLL